MSTFLRPKQIERMRATVDKTLPDRIDIMVEEKTYDDGGYVEEWTPRARDVPARVGLPLGGETDERAASTSRLADEDLYTIWLSAETPIEKTDRVVWEGRTFEVNLVLERGNWELTRRVRVKEL